MLEKIKNLLNIKPKEKELTASEKIDNLFNLLDEYTISLHLGEDLTQYGTLFCSIVQELREEIKNECGFIFPEIHIQEVSALQENEFVIYVHGEIKSDEFLIPNEKSIREEFYEEFKTVLYNNMDKIFTNDIVERYIDTAQRKNCWLVWNVTKILSVPEIKIILSDIINHGKSINNIGYVFEKIGEEILLDGGYQDCFKIRNIHNIAQNVTKVL